jgi:hypothetical protein
MEEAEGADQKDYDLASLNSDLNYGARTDFFGHKHKYHRDADGLYSPPPYLFDELSSGYNAFLVNGPISVSDDTDKGMDGTLKHYTAIGNSRLCDSITDRFGNATQLTYTTVQIAGVNTGLLNTVTDPSGRQLVFTWTNLGTQQAPAYRITSVQGPQYSVTYSYGADFNLSSVTLDPGTAPHLNRTTRFTYTTVSGESGLLASITDPNGEVASYGYALLSATNSVWVTSLTEPAGIDPSTHTPRTLSWTLNCTYGGPPPGNTSMFHTFCHNNAPGSTGINFALQSDMTLRFLQLYPIEDYTTDKVALDILTYDSNNNLTSRAQAYGCPVTFTNSFTYGPHGNLLTQFHYNNLGQPTEVDFPATASTPAETITYGYGANGRTESVTEHLHCLRDRKGLGL